MSRPQRGQPTALAGLRDDGQGTVRFLALAAAGRGIHHVRNVSEPRWSGVGPILHRQESTRAGTANPSPRCNPWELRPRRDGASSSSARPSFHPSCGGTARQALCAAGLARAQSAEGESLHRQAV
jgi:hypothetical protein